MTASTADWYTMGTWSDIIRVEMGISVNAVGWRNSAVGPAEELRRRRWITRPGRTKKSLAEWSRSSKPELPSRSSHSPWHREPEPTPGFEGKERPAPSGVEARAAADAAKS